MKRDEPEILADLIRLHNRLLGYYGVDCSKLQSEQAEEDAELIEQARAALHKHVVAAGRADIALRARVSERSLMLWFAVLHIAGWFMGAAMMDGFSFIGAVFISTVCTYVLAVLARIDLTRSKP